MSVQIAMNTKGFSVIELLVYIGIFVASAVFLVSILIVFTQIHVKQSSVNEVNDQVSFVNSTVSRLIRGSSLVETDTGSATSTLTLRMSSSTLDQTLVYASGTILYVEEGSYDPVPITDSKVTIDSFLVTKYENPGGHALVQVDLTMSYNTENIRSKFTRTVRTAISRVSAATFDSNILPNTGGTYDIGSASYSWNDAYFSGNVGIGVSPSSAASLKATGDISFTTSTKGLILVSPGGSCYRLTIDSSLQLATSSVSCP